MLRLTGLTYGERFANDLKRLDPQLKAAVRVCLEDLLKHPIPASRRHHTLAAFRPTIHKVDLTSNHAYQVTFEVHGTVARLLRVASHRHLDRSPR